MTEFSDEEELRYVGERVVVFGANYIYEGNLEAVGKNTLTLAKPRIVYETGKYTDEEYKDVQALMGPYQTLWKSGLESIGLGKKDKTFSPAETLTRARTELAQMIQYVAALQAKIAKLGG
jgi:hypothetical protein